MQRQNGFTLTELMIAMALSLTLIAMALTAFSSLNQSSRQIQQMAELQQNGQLLSGLLQNELTNVGFWGGRSNPMLAANLPLPAAPADDCYEASIDSGSFPKAMEPFIMLYARTAEKGKQINCISNALVNSELLQIKRLLGQPSDAETLRQNRFYLETDWDYSRFVDSDSPAKSNEFAYFPYQHVVFYIQNQTVDGTQIPVLMRKRLTRNAAGKAVISTDSVLDGVERMHFEFGFDSDADGQLNYQLATEQISTEHWQQNRGRILSVKFHLLLRSRQADPNYSNDQRYIMGQREFIAGGDHFRRLLISSTVFFHNAAL